MHWSRPLTFGCLAAFAALSAAPAGAQNFGNAVAAGNNEILISEPLNQYAPGAVYVYRPNGIGHWRLDTMLTAEHASNNDHFGGAMALDGSTLLVGAASEESGHGAAYVFTRDGSGAWHQSATLAPAGSAPTGTFGSAVALAGDVALVAAAGTDSAMGSVTVYRRNGQQWTREGELRAEDALPGEGFGSAVAIQGNRLFVGAARADSARGAVYIFSRNSNGEWAREAKLASHALEPRSAFGAVIATHGDELFVSAPGAFGRTGTVYVFQFDTTNNRWRQSSQLLPFEGGFAAFGSSITFAGHTAWIGAPGSNRGEGRVYRFERTAKGEWAGASKLAGPDSVSRAQFGGAVALNGRHAVIALPGADFREGAAALLSLRANRGWTIDEIVHGGSRGLAAITGGKMNCTSGKVKIFDCEGVDLLSFLPVSDIGGARGVVLNDIWGWTDPQTGHEYALVGRVDGTSFVDVTNPLQPKYLGSLPKTPAANPAVWRDIKVYKNHAFIVADGAGEHGMQVFDLTKLRDVKGAPVTFTEDAHYDRIHSAHNIVIDTATGYAYAVGSSSGGETCGGGLHMIDIRNPEQPVFAGCFADPATGRSGTGYIHDAQCVMYHGPAEPFRGHELCFNASETALGVADVTDKAHPVALSHVAYPNVGYAHQGWLTADQRYFYMDDELDELEGKSDGTRTLIWDVSDPTDPVLVEQYVSKDKSSDHNLYVVGDTVYQSNYVSGLRILDISDRTHPTQVGFFDTVPIGEDAPGFAGSWSNYPFFKSGTIIVTSMKEGLFMLKKRTQPLTP